MTTATATIGRTGTKSGISRAGRGLGKIRGLGGRIASWSAPYYETVIGDELDLLPPSKRIDAALRWHARHGRLL